MRGDDVPLLADANTAGTSKSKIQQIGNKKIAFPIAARIFCPIGGTDQGCEKRGQRRPVGF